MKDKNKFGRKSDFDDLIRIRRSQKEWLRQNKGKYKTMAGYLDSLINKEKKQKQYSNGQNTTKSYAQSGTLDLIWKKSKLKLY